MTALQQRSTSSRHLSQFGLHSVFQGMLHVSHTNLGTRVLMESVRTDMFGSLGGVFLVALLCVPLPSTIASRTSSLSAPLESISIGEKHSGNSRGHQTQDLLMTGGN